MVKVKRDFKSSMFCMLFERKEDLLVLYNAVNGTAYTNPEDLIVNTLKNAIYMGMKNDVSFICDMSLNLYEHQSTVNPNMPLRDLLYVAKILQKIVRDEDLYSSTLVKIPTPKFVVFYNGTTKQPEKRVLRLSDSFSRREDETSLELAVNVLNINPGNNTELLEKCRKLQDYMLYLEKVRTYVTELPIEQAVERAIDECIEENILKDFLLQNKSEAIEMSIFEYNEEAHLKNVRREGYEEGKAEGKAEGELKARAEAIIELLEDLGEVPEVFQEYVQQEKDLEQLKKWFKLAAKAESVNWFVEMIEKEK